MSEHKYTDAAMRRVHHMKGAFVPMKEIARVLNMNYHEMCRYYGQWKRAQREGAG